MKVKKLFIDKILGVGVVLGILGMTSTAFAIPTLQLDIVDGFYVAGAEESILTSDNAFKLYAFGNWGGNKADDTTGGEGTGATTKAEMLATQWVLSIAVTPKVVSSTGLGSFDVTQDGGTLDNILVTDDMVFGNPPIDATANPKLGSHGIFDTYFIEKKFMFDEGKTTTVYNTQDDAGAGLFDDTGTGMFYMGFQFDISGFDRSEGHELHFDLYSTKEKTTGKGTFVVRDDFAPFSHDAGTAPVPEPASLILMGSGLLGLALYGRKRSKEKE